MGTFETWDFGEGYHKVHIRNEDAYTKIKSFLGLKGDTYYRRDGETFAWDIVVDRISSEDPFFAKVVDSQKAYAKRVMGYLNLNQPDYKMAYGHHFG